MVAMPRAPLGLALQNAVMPTPQSPPVSRLAQTGQPEKPGFFNEGGMGRIIAGLIGDALLQQGGMRPVFSPMMQQRQQDVAAEAQWTRRREVERQQNREDRQWEWNNKPKDDALAPVLRDAMAWQGMTDAQREAYRQYQAARPQFIPDGLGGGQWASPTGMPAQQPAIGAVIPDPRKAGGPAPQAPGSF